MTGNFISPASLYIFATSESSAPSGIVTLTGASFLSLNAKTSTVTAHMAYDAITDISTTQNIKITAPFALFFFNFCSSAGYFYIFCERIRFLCGKIAQSNPISETIANKAISISIGFAVKTAKYAAGKALFGSTAGGSSPFSARLSMHRSAVPKKIKANSR